MKTTLPSQPVLTRQAIQALIDKLGVAKATEFWISLGYGEGDYTKERKKIFKDKTVKEIAKEIRKRK